MFALFTQPIKRHRRITPAVWLKRIKEYIRRRPHLFLYAYPVHRMARGEIRAGLHHIGRQAAADWHNRRLLAKPDQAEALRKLYQEAILCCVEHRVDRWWNFLPDTGLRSVPVLQVFLRECVLRRAGDYHEFLRIRKALEKMSVAVPANDGFYDALVGHYAQALDEIDSGLLTRDLALDPGKRPLLMALSVWGDHYLRMLLDYCLPSLMAEGNLPALCRERQPVLCIHTTPEGKRRIMGSEIMRRIEALGVSVACRMIDEELIACFADDPGNKYWHLGMVQSLDLRFAKALEADYHLLMPDTVYSESHFRGLLRAASRGHPVILRLMSGTRLEGIGPELDRYRHDGAIVIPAADLAALSVKHLHAAWKSWLMTGKDLATELSLIHVLVWEGKDTFHILSPHQSILYLDREVARRLPKRFFMTLDSELDKIIPEGCPVYCPKAEDGICVIEMSSETQRVPNSQRMPNSRNTLDEFSRMFWESSRESMALWKIFNEDVIDPLNRGLLPERSYMTDEEIKAAKRVIRDALLKSYPAVPPKRARLALAALQAVRPHPKAERMKALIDEAVKSVEIAFPVDPLQARR